MKRVMSQCVNPPTLHRDVDTGGQLQSKNYFASPKQLYLVITSEFLLHFRLNWHQNHNKLGSLTS